MPYSYSRRQELAREKGYSSYYEYRKAQSQQKGFDNPYQEQKLRQRYGETILGSISRSDLADNPIWTGQVPEGMQDDPELQSWFRRGFLTPLITHKHMTQSQKTARRNFLNAIPDFDWDVWGEYAEDYGGETDLYAGT